MFTGDLLAFQHRRCGLAGSLRHVAAFPASDYYGPSAPSRAISRRRACPPPAWRRQRGDPGRFPRSPCPDRRDRRPALPLQHRHEYAADLPRGLPTGPITGFGVAVTATARRALQSGPHPPGSSRFTLEGVPPLVPLVHLSVSLAGPGTVWQCRRRPGVVRAASHPPRASRVRLPSASPGCCDSPTAESFHLRSDHMAPRGALRSDREKQTMSKAVNSGQPRSLRIGRNRCVRSPAASGGPRRSTPGIPPC